MAFRDHTCVSVLCDNCGDEWWEEGAPHFDDRDEATTYLKKSGWLLTDNQTLCADCSRKADCDTTGHQYDDDWKSREHMGIPYRVRYCEHCQGTDYDPPWDDLMVLSGAALVVDRAAEAEEEKP